MYANHLQMKKNYILHHRCLLATLSLMFIQVEDKDQYNKPLNSVSYVHIYKNLQILLNIYLHIVILIYYFVQHFFIFSIKILKTVGFPFQGTQKF